MPQKVAFNWYRYFGYTLFLNPFCTVDPLRKILANSEDPDEMPQKVAFHQGLHCLLRQKSIFQERNTENIILKL